MSGMELRRTAPIFRHPLEHEQDPRGGAPRMDPDHTMTIPATIQTLRLALIPATPALAQAELRDISAFSELLGAAIPGEWPPDELSDARVLFLCLLEANPAWIGWLGWYAVELGADDGGPGGFVLPSEPGVDPVSGGPPLRPATLIGSVGFKGPPDADGAVEIGYSVLPSYQNRGLATEMTAALVEWAAVRGARLVQAHVRPHHQASTRVLQKLGFRDTGTRDESGAMLFAREAPLEAIRLQMDETARVLEAIHRQVDGCVRVLEAIHRDRLRCGLGCGFCCVDEITVFEVEARRIRRHHQRLLAAGEPHPVGACAFLSGDGACRVYEHRPYVCRTQGLPLRWEDEGPGDEPTEFRDICPLNESNRPIEELPPEECWEIGPFEERLNVLQAERDGGRRTRVRLRDLFARRASVADPRSFGTIE